MIIILEVVAFLCKDVQEGGILEDKLLFLLHLLFPRMKYKKSQPVFIILLALVFK